MTDQQHPITPPQWQVDAWCKQALAMGADVDAVFLKAARWGADQELEACCEQLRILGPGQQTIDRLRAARRPKPSSLKVQALEALNRGLFCVAGDADTIRRALEQLDE